VQAGHPAASRGGPSPENCAWPPASARPAPRSSVPSDQAGRRLCSKASSSGDRSTPRA